MTNISTALFCVFLFSLTAPFTRLAALEISPESIILIRILGAGVVCLTFSFQDKWLPPRKVWKGLLATSLGNVIGFNALMAFGLKEVPSGHAAVALAILPLATAIYSILRDRIRPGFKFWFFALTGTFLCFGFFFSFNVKELLLGDLLLLLAVFTAAFGYVEGGRVSREHGGPRTMAWAVIVSLPLAIPMALIHFSHSWSELTEMTPSAWFSVGYLALVSQSLGMFLWFKVLALGPMEKVALVQLIQPFLTLLAAILLLDEDVSPVTWLIATLVALCILGSNREKKKELGKLP